MIFRALQGRKFKCVPRQYGDVYMRAPLVLLHEEAHLEVNIRS